MKWISLLWSIVILGFIAFIIVYTASRSSTGPLAPAFGFTLLCWIVVSIFSPIVLALRLFRIIQSSFSFPYIFIGTANILMGVLAVCYFPSMHKPENHIGLLFLIIKNIFIGCFVCIDAFIKQIPGIRKGGGQ